MSGTLALAALGDEFVVVSDRRSPSAAFNPTTNVWRRLPDVPLTPGGCNGTDLAAWNGGLVFMGCHQGALLSAVASDEWVPFDSPGSTLPTPPLLLVPALGGLVVDGVTTTADVPTIIASPELPPLTIGGVVIDRLARPRRVTPIVDPANPWWAIGQTVELTGPRCTLTSPSRPIPEGPSTEQVLLNEARELAAVAPPTVEFYNASGSYAVACPSASAYDEALSMLRVRGERANPVDALATFAGLGPLVNPEFDIFDQVEAVLADAHRDLGDYPVASGIMSADQTHMIMSVVGVQDDSSMGYDYELRLEQSPAGRTIVSATQWAVCSRGATIPTDSQPSRCV